MPHDMNNASFYAAVCEAPTLKQVLDHNGFRPPRDPRIPQALPHGPVLGLSKESWMIRLPNRNDKGVHVHFECTNRRKLHLHIETDPYERNLDAKPEVQAERQPEIELREELHRVIRPALLALTTPKVVPPNARRPLENVSANSAGSFPSDLPDDCTPEAYAAFVARTIEAVVPTVDRCIADVMKSWPR